MALWISPFALAQTQGDLPPVAAPTSRVQVDSIAVVRSDAQKADDFVKGLFQGLRADPQLLGLEITAVQGDHTILQRTLGTVSPATQFPAGAVERAIYAVAVAQLLEQQKLKRDQDLGQLLNGRSSGVTVAALLTGQAGDNSTMAAVIEKASGKASREYVAERIFRPLAMNASRLDNGVFTTSLADMARFMAALANGGTAFNATILQTGLAQTPGNAEEPASPGWQFGLPEWRRNGWRALQLDGAADSFSSRLVFAPDAKTAYLLVLRGHADARIWLTLDDAIFDELLPPRTSSPSATGTKTPASAQPIAGTYEPDRALRALVFLKVPDRDLRVAAGNNDSLVLSGAENATLLPAGDRTWATQDNTLSAIFRNGELFLSSGAAYRPVAFYQRPVLYALVALVTALVAIGAALFGGIPVPRAWFHGRRRNVSVS
jgi:hypothetical protein